MSLSSEAAMPKAPGWRRWRLAARLLAWLALAAWSLCLLAWLILHWGILPRLDQWRPQIESLASRSLGLPVQIGEIQVRSGGWMPALELRDVVLRDVDQREALRLPRVVAALSARSILALELRFEQLLVEDARLEVRRDRAGRIRVAGLAIEQGGQAGDTTLADWFFRQHEFAIRGGTLRWVDELRSAPPLQLEDVLLVVRNGLLRHEMRLDATPPAAWGERFSVRLQARQPLLARAGDWMRWSGTLHVDLPHAEVDELKRYVSLPFELDRGRGALRAWLDWSQGRAQAATLDFALEQIDLQLAAGLAPLDFQRIAGRLSGERQDSGVKLEASRFSFTTGSGLAWPESKLALAWRHKEADAAAVVSGGELLADRLDLALMAQLAERLPLGAGVRRLLAETRPDGTVHDLTVRWDGPLDAPRQYQIKARLKALTVASSPSPEPQGVGRPGWRNADLDLLATETGGEARLALAHGALELPGVFEQALVPLHRFNAKLIWRIEPGTGLNAAPHVQVQLKEARFANDDASGEFKAAWHTGAGTGFGKGGRLPGTIEVDGNFAQGRAVAVPRYLPLGVPEPVRDYLRRAVRAGQVKSAAFRVQGDLWDFPFVNRRDGEFRIAGQVSELELAYVPDFPASGSEAAWTSPWPVLSQGTGEVIVDRTALQVRQGRGRVWGLELRDLAGGIRDLRDNQTLELEGQVRGPASDLLRYINVTPIGQWIGGALAQASLGGQADMKLALALPLKRMEQSTVKGSIQLAGGDFRQRPDVPTLAGARGRVDFTHRGVTVVGATARALGGELSFDGGTQADGSLRFQAQGQASAEGLRRAVELDPVPMFARFVQGQAPYRLTLAIVQGLPQIVVTSPLTGMAIDLPSPLAKAAESPLALRYETRPDPGGAQTFREHLRFELGSVLQAHYLRDEGPQGPRVLRGAIGVQTPVPEMAPGVRAVGEFGQVSLDAWSQVLDRLRADTAGEGNTSYQPSVIALRAQGMLAGSRRLSQVVLGLNRLDAEPGWRGNVDADQLGGYFEYRDPTRNAPAGRLYARLARLSLPPAEAAEVESLLDSATQVPALDIQIEDFELRGRKLGTLGIEAMYRAAPQGAGEWRLDKLELRMPEAHLVANGVWRTAPGATRRRTALDFKLDMSDGGALLQRLGFGAVLRGSQGVLAGKMSWLGSPLALDMASLDGQMNLAMQAGQFLKADAGAGRLLGVLSLQSLPRRLALDFRDVFQEGFAFDGIGGDVRIAAGIASTNNLRLRGVQAAALMEGQADIGRETQDLRVIVVPEINAGTASLAYAAINPAIGLGTFFAQWLLRGPLREANTRELHITGSWDDPKVEPVERAPGKAMPVIEALPAEGAASSAKR